MVGCLWKEQTAEAQGLDETEKSMEIDFMHNPYGEGFSSKKVGEDDRKIDARSTSMVDCPQEWKRYFSQMYGVCNRNPRRAVHREGGRHA